MCFIYNLTNKITAATRNVLKETKTSCIFINIQKIQNENCQKYLYLMMMLLMVMIRWSKILHIRIQDSMGVHASLLYSTEKTVNRHSLSTTESWLFFPPSPFFDVRPQKNVMQYSVALHWAPYAIDGIFPVYTSGCPAKNNNHRLWKCAYEEKTN